MQCLLQVQQMMKYQNILTLSKCQDVFGINGFILVARLGLLSLSDDKVQS